MHRHSYACVSGWPAAVISEGRFVPPEFSVDMRPILVAIVVILIPSLVLGAIECLSLNSLS